MIRARHHWLYQLFFDRYFRWIFNRQFRAFEGELLPPPSDGAVCWLSNHTSWWDGVWPLLLHTRIQRKFYVLMLENQLKTRLFLSRLGAFSIQPGSRTMVDTGTYMRNVLQDARNCVLIYPQGQIESAGKHHIHFQPGILRYALQSGEDVQWLFSAFFTEYGDQPKPTVYHYHHWHNFNPQTSATELERAYQLFYDSCRIKLEAHIHLKYRPQ